MACPLGDSLEEVTKRPVEDIAQFVENMNLNKKCYVIAGIFCHVYTDTKRGKKKKFKEVKDIINIIMY